MKGESGGFLFCPVSKKVVAMDLRAFGLASEGAYMSHSVKMLTFQTRRSHALLQEPWAWQLGLASFRKMPLRCLKTFCSCSSASKLVTRPLSVRSACPEV